MRVRSWSQWVFTFSFDRWTRWLSTRDADAHVPDDEPGVLEYALKSPDGAPCLDPPLYASQPREAQLGCIVEHTFQGSVHDKTEL